MSSNLLHKCGRWPRLGQATHVVQVAPREPTAVREGKREVDGELVDDLGTPARGVLPVQDGLADGPVQLDERGVDRSRSGPLRGPNLDLQLGQQMWVVVGQRQLSEVFTAILMPLSSDRAAAGSWPVGFEPTVELPPHTLSSSANPCAITKVAVRPRAQTASGGIDRTHRNDPE